MGNDRWDGGHIHRQEDGKRLFIIEKERSGRRYHISTRCYSESAAVEHWKRFQADPEKYKAEMRMGPDRAAVITPQLILGYRAHLLERERPTTRQYANEMAHRLTEWMEDLRGADLRHVQLAALKAAVDKRGTCRQHRIIAVKGYCRWLRQERFILDRRTDPTLDLVVPQSSPEKHRRRKAVEVERVEAALRKLDPPYRDCLAVSAATGWHVTELARFARHHESEIAKGSGTVLAVLVTRHKNGGFTRTPICEEAVVRAARRIRAKGVMPRRMNGHLREACERAKVEPFTFGVMRHTVATWGIERGALPSAVAEFLGHNLDTSKRFYQDAAVPTNVIPLPRFG